MMQPLPQLSICIPAYQKPQALKRLLQTVEKQTYKQFEIIITDDTANNEVADIAALFANKMVVKYYKNAVSLGMAGNWNKCIENANFNWIKMMHDDDFFTHENALQIFAESIQTGNYDFVFSAANKVGKNDIEVSKLDANKLASFKENIDCLIFQNYIGHPSVTLFKKDIAIQFDKSFKWVIDIDFYIRYLHKNQRWHYIDETLVSITKDENQVSAGCFNNPKVEIPEYLSLLEKLKLHTGKYVFFCVWELVRKFKIKGSDDVVKYYPLFTANPLLQRIVAIQKYIPNLVLKQTPINRKLMKYFYHKYN